MQIFQVNSDIDTLGFVKLLSGHRGFVYPLVVEEINQQTVVKNIHSILDVPKYFHREQFVGEFTEEPIHKWELHASRP